MRSTLLKFDSANSSKFLSRNMFAKYNELHGEFSLVLDFWLRIAETQPKKELLAQATEAVDGSMYRAGWNVAGLRESISPPMLRLGEFTAPSSRIAGRLQVCRD